MKNVSWHGGAHLVQERYNLSPDFRHFVERDRNELQIASTLFLVCPHQIREFRTAGAPTKPGGQICCHSLNDLSAILGFLPSTLLKFHNSPPDLPIVRCHYCIHRAGDKSARLLEQSAYICQCGMVLFWRILLCRDS